MRPRYRALTMMLSMLTCIACAPPPSPAKRPVEAVCDAWRGAIMETQPGDPRRFRENERLHLTLYLAACAGAVWQ